MAQSPSVAGRSPCTTDCSRMNIQQKSGRQHEGVAALGAAKPLWFTGQSTPDACEPLFAALLAKGELSSADRRARFRLATEAGNVRLAGSESRFSQS